MTKDSVVFKKETSTDFVLFVFFCNFLYSIEPPDQKKLLEEQFKEDHIVNNPTKSIFYYYVRAKLMNNITLDAVSRYFTGKKKNISLPIPYFKSLCKVFEDTYKKLSPTVKEEYKLVNESFISWRDRLYQKYVSETITDIRDTEVISKSLFDLVCSGLDKIIVNEENKKNQDEIAALYNSWKLWVRDKFGKQSFLKIGTEDFYPSKINEALNNKKTDSGAQLSNQTALNEFRLKPLYFYHGTKNDKNILYWNLAVIDFSKESISETGRLITEVTVPDYDGSQYEYIFEIVRNRPTDSILLTLRVKQDSISRIYFAVFNAIKNYYDKFVPGIIYHDDWTGKWRLSSCLLGLAPISEKKETEKESKADKEQKPEPKSGRVPINEAVYLQKVWHEKFDEDYKKPIFEDLPIITKQKNSNNKK